VNHVVATPDEPLLFRFFNEVGIIAQLAERLFESVMPAGMTLAQFSVLNHFVRLGGERTPAALASAFQVTRATMTSTLQRLEAKGLVAVAPDPSDGRSKRVSITDAGRGIRLKCIEGLQPEMARLGTVIDLQSIEALLPELAGVRRALDTDRSRL
jgi:DNA-binding MarR family transcriptional regulator